MIPSAAFAVLDMLAPRVEVKPALGFDRRRSKPAAR
jgi:hypothetical protein